MLRLALAALLLTPGALAQAAYDVTLPTSGMTGEALDAFQRGVELLHSFEYDDARDAFVEAQRLQPTAAMAYWGEAMTHNHPVWQRQGRDAGSEVLARQALVEDSLGVRSESNQSFANGSEPPNGRMRSVSDAFIESLGILFGADDSGYEESSKEARDDAYLAWWEAHVRENIGTASTDARALHALALLGSAHEGRDYEVYGRAAEVAQSVLDRDPEHPGALHYLIHAYDDPDHAELALPAARAYSEIVSAASHALHMPTHIYFALGLWDEASALNVRAFEAARDASTRRGEPLNNHGWHALYWLAYSELQRDSVDSAIAVYQQARELHDADSSRLSVAHLARIRAHLVTAADIEGRLVEDYVGPWFELPREQMSPATQAADLWAESLVRGTLVEGHEERMALARALDAPDADASVRATALMVAVEDAGSGPEAVAMLLEAARRIDVSPIDFGPPSPALFPHEALAVAYHEAARPQAALCLTDAVLARAPGRRITEQIRQFIAEGDRAGHSYGGEAESRLGFDLPDVPGCDG